MLQRKRTTDAYNRKYISSRLMLCFEPLLPRRFAVRMRRRMEKNSPNASGIAAREFGPIGRILRFKGAITPSAALTGRICVHVHLYHTAMADDFATVLNRLNVDFALLVSITEMEDEEAWALFFKKRLPIARHVVIKRVANRGRDVLPWVVIFAEEIQKYDFFCHMHTKQSNHNDALAGWRSFLVHSIFGSPSIVGQILHQFEEDVSLGLVFPPYFGALGEHNLPPHWGKNEALASHILNEISPRNYPAKCPDFPAGSFFWARVSCLKPLFALGLRAEDFDAEQGQVDGTLAHALERVVGALPAITGMSSLCVTVDIDYETASSGAKSARFGGASESF